MDLTNHSKSHLKVKPHVCSICSKSFALKANWRYHMMYDDEYKMQNKMQILFFVPNKNQIFHFQETFWRTSV